MIHPEPDKDGKPVVGLVPSNQVNDAIQAGYKIVPNPTPPPEVAAQETPPPVPVPAG
jgi:hypothetical protein